MQQLNLVDEKRPLPGSLPKSSEKNSINPMKELSDIPFSVLNLSPINQGSTAAESFRNSLSLAKHTERLGFHRYWLGGFEAQSS